MSIIKASTRALCPTYQLPHLQNHITLSLSLIIFNDQYPVSISSDFPATMNLTLALSPVTYLIAPHTRFPIPISIPFPIHTPTQTHLAARVHDSTYPQLSHTLSDHPAHPPHPTPHSPNAQSLGFQQLGSQSSTILPYSFRKITWSDLQRPTPQAPRREEGRKEGRGGSLIVVGGLTKKRDRDETSLRLIMLYCTSRSRDS